MRTVSARSPRRPAILVSVAALVLGVTAACPMEPGDDAGTPDDDGGEPDPTPDPEGCTATDAEAPLCQDEQILALFHDDANAGAIANIPDGDGFLSDVDATAGGLSGTQGFLYARFTDEGLVKVDITDEDSLESMDWDIALRRYLVRINSGVSGPSCVAAARIPGTALFDDVTEVPAALTLNEEIYFNDACELVPDGSGLDTSPATVLSSYWTYPGCVAMSHYVFAVGLADGRRVKLEVIHYYSSGQDGCDDEAVAGAGAANLRLRWAYLGE